MSEHSDRLEELLRRTRITTKCRYRASERLERHQRFSQWVVALISAALVFIPLLQVFGISAGIGAIYLNATQATLAVLVLVYSLLLGQENFVSKAQAMHRNGVELGRFAIKLAGFSGAASDEEYSQLTEQYYNILEKYDNHKPVDYLFTQLSERPSGATEVIVYLFRMTKASFYTLLGLSHYVAVLAFVGYIFVALFAGITSHIPAN